LLGITLVSNTEFNDNSPGPTERNYSQGIQEEFSVEKQQIKESDKVHVDENLNLEDLMKQFKSLQ
jgi:hypothetical protein